MSQSNNRKRICRQCGKPLEVGVRYNVILCPECRKANADRLNRENNRRWYKNNRHKRKLKQSCDTENRNVSIKEQDNHSQTVEAIQQYRDYLIKKSEDFHKLFDRELETDCELIDTPYGPVCKNAKIVKHSKGVEDPAERHYSTTMRDGREWVIETRGQCHMGH